MGLFGGLRPRRDGGDARLSHQETVTVAFILSARRSGSTWLNLVLGSHGWAMNLGEYHRPFTMPGHVACRLCEADGLKDCTVLGGIERVARDDAFHFAALRSGKPVLIDASKDLDWCRHFLAVEGIDARLIHLVRHPCGYVESEGRRSKLSPAELLAEWESVNRGIEAFIAAADVPAMLADYDDLADAPERFVPPLCEFLGHPFEPAALAYWNFPHHGLGGNGAASVYLRKHPNGTFITGDDAFYAGMEERPTAADRRWMERLPRDFCRMAVATPYAGELARRLGRPTFEAPV